MCTLRTCHKSVSTYAVSLVSLTAHSSNLKPSAVWISPVILRLGEHCTLLQMTRRSPECSVHSVMILGAATAEATASHGESYCARGHASGTYRCLGRTGLTVSAIGFGCQGVRISDIRHQAALREALYSGCNLIDSAAHYGAGDADELVGQVLAQSDGLSRDRLVIVTKLGAFSGSDLAWLRSQGGIDDTRLSDDPQVWYSFAADYLRGQLKRSLARLSLEKVDIVLLESPEFLYDVSIAARPNASEEEHVQFVAQALLRAFECLEELVHEGLAGWYGVTSNALSLKLGEQLSLPLPLLVETAEAAGGTNHHFGVVQMPLSIFDVTAHEEDSEYSLQQFASRLGLGVMVGRPLRPVVNGRIVRLTDFDTAGVVRLRRLMKATASLENEFAIGLGKAFEVEGLEGSTRLFDNAVRLKDVAASLDDYVLWREFVEDVLEMELSGLIGQIDAGLNGPLKVAWTFWLERYIHAVSQLVDGLSLRCARSSQRRSRRIARKLRPLVESGESEARLAQLSVAAVRDLPGVDAVLVGMRRIQYAIDAMETMNWTVKTQSPARIAGIAQKLISSGVR